MVLEFWCNGFIFAGIQQKIINLSQLFITNHFDLQLFNYFSDQTEKGQWEIMRRKCIIIDIRLVYIESELLLLDYSIQLTIMKHIYLHNSSNSGGWFNSSGTLLI